MSKYSDKLVSEVIELKNSGFTVTQITELKRLTRNQVQYILYQLKRERLKESPDAKFEIEAVEKEREPTIWDKLRIMLSPKKGCTR